MVPSERHVEHVMLDHASANAVSGKLPLAAPCSVSDPCPTLLVCQPVCAVCYGKPAVPGGNSTSDCHPQAPVGYNCTAICNKGFSGVPNATCGTGGKWVVQGTCQQIGECACPLGSCWVCIPECQPGNRVALPGAAIMLCVDRSGQAGNVYGIHDAGHWQRWWQWASGITSSGM